MRCNAGNSGRRRIPPEHLPDERQGLFCALYSDRGSHFFVTPKASEKVDKTRRTQVGRAMQELGVQMTAALKAKAGAR